MPCDTLMSIVNLGGWVRLRRVEVARTPCGISLSSPVANVVAVHWSLKHVAFLLWRALNARLIVVEAFFFCWNLTFVHEWATFADQQPDDLL